MALLEAVQKQIAERTGGPVGELKSAQEILTYLSWLSWHCGRFAAVTSFLDAARSDIVAILYAGAIGLERSAYLHARSLLENLVRHCYYNANPALYVARHLDDEEDVRDPWTELFNEIQKLPHFRPTRDTLEGDDGAAPQSKISVAGKSALFAGLKSAYQDSSRFVHGSTVRYRSAYEGIGSITIDPTRTRELGEFLQTVGELSLLLLSMIHLGPYLLISQPMRRYILQNMRSQARTLFLRCMQQVSLPWARLQRAAALRTLEERKRMPVPSWDGTLLDADRAVLVVRPDQRAPLK